MFFLFRIFLYIKKKNTVRTKLRDKDHNKHDSSFLALTRRPVHKAATFIQSLYRTNGEKSLLYPFHV